MECGAACFAALGLVASSRFTVFHCWDNVRITTASADVGFNLTVAGNDNSRFVTLRLVN